MAREQFVNNAATTLNGAIDGVVTSITVTDGSVFPATGEFRILIDSEIILVTARATHVLTVERGADGTSAASHLTLADVTAVLTKGALTTFTDDTLAVMGQFGGSSKRKPFRLLDLTGNTLTSADFTWLNEGTSSVADDPSGGMTVTVNETTGDWKMLTIAMPTPPFSLTAHIQFGPGFTRSGSGSAQGIGFRDSASGRFELAYAEIGDEIEFFRYTSPSTFSAAAATNNPMHLANDNMWLRVEDDNTNIYAYSSPDGIYWRLIGQDTRTAWLAAADQLVWAFNPRGEADKLMHLRSFVVHPQDPVQGIDFQIEPVTFFGDTGTTQTSASLIGTPKGTLLHHGSDTDGTISTDLGMSVSLTDGLAIANESHFSSGNRQRNDAAATTLNGAIDDVTTTVILVNGNAFPPSSKTPYTIVCEAEEMTVTNRSSNTLTVTRGVNGSTAVSHLDTTAVTGDYTQARNYENNDYVLGWPTQTGELGPASRALTSIVGGQLQINWSNSNAAGDYKGAMLHFAGSELEAKATSKSITHSVAATQAITGVGFAPDAVIWIGGSAGGHTNLQTRKVSSGIGFASNGGGQGCCLMQSIDDNDFSENHIQTDLTHLMYVSRDGTTDEASEVTSWDADGITLTGRINTMSQTVGLLFLKLGAPADSDVISIDLPISTGEQTFAFGFEPRLVMLITSGATALGTLQNVDGAWAFSNIMAERQACTSMFLEHNASPAASQALHSDKALKIPDGAGGTLWEADFVGFSASGLTLDFTTVGASVTKAIAIGFR